MFEIHLPNQTPFTAASMVDAREIAMNAEHAMVLSLSPDWDYMAHVNGKPNWRTSAGWTWDGERWMLMSLHGGTGGSIEVEDLGSFDPAGSFRGHP
jgi:hypothetical protein